jgi:hypothetical protein
MDDTQTPKQKLAAAMAELGLTITAEFVPWSKSRNAKPDAKIGERSLNWHVTLKRGDRDVLNTDYFAGIGHCPSYKHGKHDHDIARCVIYECEHGVKAWLSRNTDTVSSASPRKPILPDATDIMYGLISNSSALDHADFESWASDFGYDTDSRSAERTYLACLKSALALRAAVGESGLAALTAAVEGY